jgi:hypothetical protein
MVTGGYAVGAPTVTETTPSPGRTPVSQRHCQRDPDHHDELATAPRKVVIDLYDAVKYAIVADFRERAAYGQVTVLPSPKGVRGSTKWIFQPHRGSLRASNPERGFGLDGSMP